MEKMREEFEAWANESGYKINLDGDDFVICALWDTWKASRAALCVELPRPTYDYVMECYMMVADYVAKSLDAAGVKFK